ncbi:hypothetical protein GpartN1_g7359.t1 [Galdieria partita]|uniref:Alanine--tRNA ligase n=1 Tax=Galdieria partita TaxID=83374 RepID=A0A9C7Q324_9RHOD|nr:hypothetical protein GpartN1_g7359.t1 [Galdieria partita]
MWPLKSRCFQPLSFQVTKYSMFVFVSSTCSFYQTRCCIACCRKEVPWLFCRRRHSVTKDSRIPWVYIEKERKRKINLKRFFINSDLVRTKNEKEETSTDKGSFGSTTERVGKYMTSVEIRQAFMDFYRSKKHLNLDSASLVPEDPSILLTIAGMVPFKQYFLGLQEPPASRVVTCQRCIRTNDIENVGVTKRHHTFFEMLGNFSFGDYFKEEAILWSWELLTVVFEIPSDRLVVSVFKDDDEAYNIWRDIVGIDSKRIFRMDERDNFWSSGPTGPCGPCSEIYFDFYPNREDIGSLEDDMRYLELYNLVFMQYNRFADGTLEPLKQKNIDTGMGLERMAQVLQRVPNNYETDLMKPYLDETCRIAKIPSYDSASEDTKVSLKVIGDHIRAVVNLIADGVHVSNVGRGYILRRLIRRTVRHGRQLGIEKPFLKQLAQVAFSLSSEAGFVHITNNHKAIERELQTEELRFLDVLKKGEIRLNEILDMPSKIISGADAFELYDTFGFPLELTEEMAHEYGKTVDVDSFYQYMEEQRMKARASHSFQSHSVNTVLPKSLHSDETIFEGYHSYQLARSRVTLILDKVARTPVETASVGDEVYVALDHTPFYAESGGQVADHGILISIDSNVPCQVVIDDVQKKNGIWLHRGKVKTGVLKQNQLVRSEIDINRRNLLRVHHTATHLLHAALKLCIDKSISQAGSLVDTERLRFDFSCPRSLTEEDLYKLEDIINLWVVEGHDTIIRSMSYDKAVQRGAIAMFNEKYESNVRVVDIPGVSMELCGGTHVENTREIGLFKIISESGVASGVRRIEAVAGSALMDWIRKRDAILSSSSRLIHCTVDELPDRLRGLQTQMKKLQQERQSLQMQLLSMQCKLMVSHAKHEGNSCYLVSMLDTQNADQLRTCTQQICNTLGDRGIVVLLSLWRDEGKFGICASVGRELVEKGIGADSIVKQVLQITGGRGGGKAAFAQGGGKSNANLEQTLAWLDKTCREVLQK